MIRNSLGKLSNQVIRFTCTFPGTQLENLKKLTQFWRGPFAVEAKLSDLTYKVNCGPRGKPQVIHVDRIRLKRRQKLSHEKPGVEKTSDGTAPEKVERADSNDEDK